MKESWWKRLVEGDAQEMIKCYTRLSSSLNLFIVSMPQKVFVYSSDAQPIRPRPSSVLVGMSKL